MDVGQILVWSAFYVSLYFIVFWLLTFLEYGILSPSKPSRKLPFVTIAIPAWNEEKTIMKTLQSVLDLEYPPEKLDIIVVDDGSKDKTRFLVNQFITEHPSLSLRLFQQPNGGKGSAMNVALRHAKGEFFVCLDADSMPAPSALKLMLPYFTSDNVAVVLPLMKIYEPKTLLQKLQWCEYLLNFFYKSLMASLNCVHVAPGPFSVYRKKALESVGGFAEKNLTEDFEVTLKLQKKHYQLIQLFDAVVYTHAPYTFKAFCKQRNRWYKGTLLNLFTYRSMILNKRYGDFGLVQLPRVLLSGFLAVGFIGFTSYRYVLQPLFKRIGDWSSIHFDFTVFLRHFTFDWSWIDLNYTNLFFALVSISLSLFIIRYAYRYTKEKVFRYGFLSVPAYIFAYGLLASFVWLTVFLDLVRGKRQQW